MGIQEAAIAMIGNDEGNTWTFEKLTAQTQTICKHETFFSWFSSLSNGVKISGSSRQLSSWKMENLYHYVCVFPLNVKNKWLLRFLIFPQQLTATIFPWNFLSIFFSEKGVTSNPCWIFKLAVSALPFPVIVRMMLVTTVDGSEIRDQLTSWGKGSWNLPLFTEVFYTSQVGKLASVIGKGELLPKLWCWYTHTTQTCHRLAGVYRIDVGGTKYTCSLAISRSWLGSSNSKGDSWN